ncbi:MAG: hypothetical protein KAY22_26365 [Rhizorhabdus sp.]|jgi:hypothetical protein|nr:hypothetical protein [Rhizorhabdus sp.]MBP8235823.1 hypothetical protein [Rhizorhabdus sp.]
MSVVEAIARLNRLMQRIRQRQPRVRVALDVWTPSGTRAVRISTGP